MLRGIIFDFNGVIIDDEPLHFLAFQEAFKKEGIPLTEKEYFDRYLAFDDRTCAREILLDHKREASRKVILDLSRAKKGIYSRLLQTRLRLFPGALQFIRECAETYPLAIASGALRSEIHSILRKFNLSRSFVAVVSADDVVNGKPHPETFLRAWKLLRRSAERGVQRIQKNECLVIEDSLHGIVAAHEAGMKCAAVAHSYPLRKLVHADFRARCIRDLRLPQLEALFKNG
jgi:beta-phosphoglucomutase